MPRKPEPDAADSAIRLAERLLTASLAETKKSELDQMERIAGMIGNPDAKRFSLQMTDRIGRADDSSRTATMWRRLLNRFDLRSGFSFSDRMLLKLGSLGSRVLPGLVMSAVKGRLREESREVILSAEDGPLSNYLEKRYARGTRVNLNQLGEAVLGEEEAEKRLESLIELLQRDDVNYVSAKISAVFSQINLVAWDDTVRAIKERLRPLYRVAMDLGKFVNLDMEEYRDLDLTIQVFRELLSEEEFHEFSAGVVLQAYLPDSIKVQRELTDWAKARCTRGGAPIKVRLVKGANLAMERVEAEWHGWNLATHPGKHETDACFKNMLEFACRPGNAEAVRIGVGSHNLFDVALALVLREQRGVAEWVEIEMLEGMAPAQARVVQAEVEGLLLYAPVVKEEDFGSALAYLIRRLDENTAKGNFLASLFSLKLGSPDWIDQRDRFLAAWRDRSNVDVEPNRHTLPQRKGDSFENEPDSDWTRKSNRHRLTSTPTDESRPPEAGPEEIEACLAKAVAARKTWATRSEKERAGILRACGDQLAKTRFESIAILRDEGKKAAPEADTEVSEAIDFTRYYAEVGTTEPGLQSEALGTVVVAPPWNFPFAIPCGGVSAALMAGNSVILKPAPESVRIGWWLAKQMWEAGVPREALQFVACSDGDTGRQLIEDPRTSAVILTGAFETARRFQSWRPSLKLFAETSGKNALVVSAMSDRELAAKDLVKSAFGHSGQKCSAASLGILEAEVYEDETFLRQLKDAAASLAVGSSADLKSIVTPLVQKPGENLTRALTVLDDGEKWLLKPRQLNADPCLWSPGIKRGVRPGSWFHHTECFGPVLGLMRAENLEEAIEFQNAVAFGLTAGLHSLDETEIEFWKNRAEAGNLYINRGITGAIVRRQPFGGWKRSSIGPGSKAGGPNYVNLFRILGDEKTVGLGEARDSYEQAWRTHFSKSHDPSGLFCESNKFRYRPCRGVLLRLEQGNDRTESMARLASEITGTPLIVSLASDETDSELARRLPDLADRIDFLRTIDGPPQDELLRAVATLDLNWIDSPLSASGRLELTRWLREQSVTETLHRYGNVFGNPSVPRASRIQK